jgi:hypothetical protein
MGKRAFIGFDGFVDTIVRAVDRHADGKRVYIETIGDFGQRISNASGKSTNIELEVVGKKVGGNGPILSAALRALGFHTTCIGPLDHEIFAQFSTENNAISIGYPGETRALEFADGKILFGEMNGVEKIDIDRILQHVGEEKFVKILHSCDLLCFVNWTMLTKLDGILRWVLGKMNRGDKFIFFDIADPAKRSGEDVGTLCTTIRRFNGCGKVILGLNLKEASHLLPTIGGREKISETPESLTAAAKTIGQGLGIHACFIHANTVSAGYNGASAFASGYFSPHPKISTGAGDHFNGGFLSEYADNFDLLAALHAGSAAAKYYVDSASSPNALQVRQTRMD